MAAADGIFARRGQASRSRQPNASIPSVDQEYESWVRLGAQEEHNDVLRYWSVSWDALLWIDAHHNIFPEP